VIRLGNHISMIMYYGMARAVLGLLPGVNSKGPGAMGLALSVDSPPFLRQQGSLNRHPLLSRTLEKNKPIVELHF
jgi:hypothetical protein